MRNLFACLLLAVALAAPAVPARAQAPLELVKAGDFPAARAELARRVAGRPDAALFLAYLEGVIRLETGRPDEAAGIFRDILSVAPDFEPARRELTAALALTGQTGAALYHAEKIIGTTTDERLRATLEQYIAANREGPGSGVSTRFVITPSTNLNRGSSQETILVGGVPFEIDDTAREEGGLSVSAGATFWRRSRLSESADLTLLGSLDATSFSEGTVDNEIVLGAKAVFGHRVGRARVTFGPVLEKRFRTGDDYLTRIGLDAGLSYDLRPGRRLSVSVAAHDQNYADLSYLDGSEVEGSVGLVQQLSPSLTVGATLSLASERTRRDYLDHDDLGLEAVLAKEWSGGLITAFRAGFSRNSYLGDFPSKTEPRTDDIARLGLSVRHRAFQIGSFVPELSYVYTRSASNVEFYDYDSHDLAIALSRNF